MTQSSSPSPRVPAWTGGSIAERFDIAGFDPRGVGLNRPAVDFDTNDELRQVAAPGVDTKFVERHRSVLAALLGIASGSTAFPLALGLAIKPATVRMRFDPAVLGLPSGLTEATFRSEELRIRNVRPSVAVIIENEITYLSVPVPAGGVVLWGRGYDADEPTSLD